MECRRFKKANTAYLLAALLFSSSVGGGVENEKGKELNIAVGKAPALANDTTEVSHPTFIEGVPLTCPTNISKMPLKFWIDSRKVMTGDYPSEMVGRVESFDKCKLHAQPERRSRMECEIKDRLVFYEYQDTSGNTIALAIADAIEIGGEPQFKIFDCKGELIGKLLVNDHLPTRSESAKTSYSILDTSDKVLAVSDMFPKYFNDPIGLKHNRTDEFFAAMNYTTLERGKFFDTKRLTMAIDTDHQDSVDWRILVLLATYHASQ